MRTETSDEALLIKYLLGYLTEAEQVRVEDRAFTDHDYLASLNAVEADLIDAYVRGLLTRNDRRAFEHRFLHSPQRRGKIEFAQTLARLTAEMTPEPLPKPATGWRSWLGPVRTWSPALSFVSAGAVLSIAGVSWLAIENASMRARFATLHMQRQQLEYRTHGLERELSDAHTQAEALSAQVQKRLSEQQTHPPLIASLVLTPGLSRAASNEERVVIEHGAQIVRVEIQLESRDDYPSFRADLRTQSGKEILSFADLPRLGSGDAHSVLIDVPVNALVTGEYELSLKSLRDGRDPEDIGYYYFRVQKR
jgi:anti-sigma-K factor RskA